MKTATAIKWIINVTAGATLSTMTFLFGDIDIPFQVLLFFLVSDYLSGVFAAWQTKELSSQQGILGIAKKAAYLFLIASVYQLDKLLGTGGALKTLAQWALIVNEAMSVTENLGQAGVPIPNVIKEKLAQLSEDHGVEKKL